MSAGKTSRPSVVLAASIFAALLAILFLSPRGHSGAHQRAMEVASLFMFVAAVFSLFLKSSPGAPRQRMPSGWLLTPLLLGIAAYAPALRLGFISDDFTHVLWARGALLPILGEQFAKGQYGTFFRPLGFASLAVDHRLWHEWPTGWHLTNLALHLAAIASVFRLTTELGCDAEICGTAALFFAVLPVNTEAVAWVAARFDLLATLAMLWTLIFYYRARNAKSNSLVLYALAAVCFLIALLSKESGYVIPLALCTIELLLFRRRNWRTPALFFALAGCAILYRMHVLGSLGGYRAASGAAGSFSLGTSTLLALMVRAPSELLFAINWQQPRVVFGYFLAAATAALLLSLAVLPPRNESRRMFALSLAWCFFAALPAQSLLMIPPTLTNTRVLYFSSVGAALFIALLLARIGDLRWRRGWTVALTICLVVTTWHDLAAWRHASRITQDFLSEVKSDVPDPPAGAEFVLHDMPRWAEGGVYLLLHRALADSLCLTYGREDLTARRDDRPEAPGARNRIDLYWVGDWRGQKRPLIAAREHAQQ